MEEILVRVQYGYKYGGLVELADTRDLSSLEGNFVWVPVPYPSPDERSFTAGIKYVFSNYSEEELKSLIASCTSVAELGRKLGLCFIIEIAILKICI